MKSMTNAMITEGIAAAERDGLLKRTQMTNHKAMNVRNLHNVARLETLLYSPYDLSDSHCSIKMTK